MPLEHATTDAPDRPVETIAIRGRIVRKVRTRRPPQVLTRRTPDGRWETLIVEPESETD